MLKYRVNYANESWRVWRTDWSHDTFEVLTNAEFEALKKQVETGPLARFHLVTLTEAEDP